MKKVTLFLLPITASLIIVSCKSKKPVSIAKQEGLIEVTTPFDSKEYRSDNDYFRAVQSGKSSDLATSKKIAKQNTNCNILGFHLHSAFSLSNKTAYFYKVQNGTFNF